MLIRNLTSFAWHKKPTLLLNVDCQLSAYTRAHTHINTHTHCKNERDSKQLDCLAALHAVRKRFLIETKNCAEREIEIEKEKMEQEKHGAERFKMSTKLRMSYMNRALCHAGRCLITGVT